MLPLGREIEREEERKEEEVTRTEIEGGGEKSEDNVMIKCPSEGAKL